MKAGTCGFLIYISLIIIFWPPGLVCAGQLDDFEDDATRPRQERSQPVEDDSSDYGKEGGRLLQLHIGRLAAARKSTREISGLAQLKYN
ncbi:MAG: hypothetical protein SWH61_08050 [Thermodesulfobacteriota bacterium]|nr:hypothetical protein [Thermodesulfobacteriota bacterium]